MRKFVEQFDCAGKVGYEMDYNYELKRAARNDDGSIMLLAYDKDEDNFLVYAGMDDDSLVLNRVVDTESEANELFNSRLA